MTRIDGFYRENKSAACIINTWILSGLHFLLGPLDSPLVTASRQNICNIHFLIVIGG